jgi:hypothetical protein
MAEIDVFLRELLVALADADEAAPDTWVLDPYSVATAAGLSFRRGWIEKAVPYLKSNGWVSVPGWGKTRIADIPPEPRDKGHRVELTLEGLVEAEHFRATAREAEASRASIAVPAADRFVSRSDNEAAFSDADEKLTALADAVRGTNDLFADHEERLAVAREVEGIRDLLRQTKVRAFAIWAAITGNGVVRWLSLAVGAGVVGEAAVGALSALGRLVGMPV